MYGNNVLYNSHPPALFVRERQQHNMDNKLMNGLPFKIKDIVYILEIYLCRSYRYSNNVF